METNKKNAVRMLISLLPVQIISIISTTLGSLISGILIGNYLGESAIGAVSLINPLNLLFCCFASVFVSGAGILCGKLLGKGDSDKLKNVFSTVLSISVFIGIIFMMVMLFFSKPLAVFLGAKGSQIIIDTSNYLRGLAFVAIPTIVIPVLSMFLQILNDAKFSFFTMLFLGVFTAIFGYSFLEFTDLGIFGVGLAVSISYLAIFFIFLLRFLIKHKDYRLRIKQISYKYLGKMFLLGSPMIFFNISGILRNYFINILSMEIGGEKAISALGIFMSFNGVFDAVTPGIMNAAILIFSVFISLGDMLSVKTIFKYSFSINFIINTIEAIILIIFSNQITLLFGGSESLFYYVKVLIILCWVTQPIFSFSLAQFAVFQANGKLSIVSLECIISMVIIPVIVGDILGHLYGVEFVFAIFGMVQIALVVVYLIMTVCVIKKFPTNIYDICWMKKTQEESDKLSVSVKTIDEVVTVSEQIINYCKKYNIDSKRSYMSGLCTEEIVGNIVTHGFRKSKKKNLSVDIFVSIVEDKIKINICDNAVHFNPKLRLEASEGDDSFKNIGIKLALKAVKEFNYDTTYGMNVMSMEL